jgi:hypothetical protein
MSGPSSRSLGERARPLLVALVAGGSYGSWAAFAHHRLGPRIALRTGLTQVALSLTATLVLVLVLERLFRRQSNPVRGFWFASVGTSMLGTAWLVVGYAVTGTPHIAVTITPHNHRRRIQLRLRPSAARAPGPQPSSGTLEYEHLPYRGQLADGEDPRLGGLT